MFSITKVNKKTYMECIKFYFDSMVHGVDGQRLKILNNEYKPED